MFKSLCLSGGGVLGFIHLGFLHYLESKRLTRHIDTVVGTSIGAVVGALFCLGMDSKAIHARMMKINHDIMPFSGIQNFFTHFGMETGEYFMAFLTDIFLERNVSPLITLKEMVEKFRIRLIITGTNLSQLQVNYFTPETHPDMRVLDAVRITISLPFLLTYALSKDDICVDGGLKDNYPIQYCLRDFKRRHPHFTNPQHYVIGSYIETMVPGKIANIEDYIRSILACFLKRTEDEIFANPDLYVGEGKILCTVFTPVSDMSSMDFDANGKKRDVMFAKGYFYAKEYLGHLWQCDVLLRRKESIVPANPYFENVSQRIKRNRSKSI